MCVDPNGFSRSPEQPYLHYVVMPSPIGVADLTADLSHAASDSFGSLYLSPRTMMAQATRAILLASATAATFVGRHSINRPSQGRFCVPCLRAQRITAIAPTTSNRRKYRLPCFVMLPSLSLPPVACCLGTNPIHA